MPVPSLDDRALDSLLSGARSPQSGLDWLLPFVEELGEACREPAPVVQPALASLLAEGFSTPQGALPAAPVDRVVGPAAQAARWSTWGMKLGGLGLAAKAGLGLGLVAATTTAAGAAGVLPEPAQHAVAVVVEAATPFSFPDAANDKASFGATVSTDATGASDGVAGVDGKAVADAAKDRSDPGAGPDALPPGTGVGPSPAGATGLDRANETPAAGHPPTSTPVTPTAPGAPASKGLNTAGDTPAADKVPPSVPPATSPAGGAGSPAGLDKAGTTPAGDRVPPVVPRRP